MISLGHWECKSDNLTLNAYMPPKADIFCYTISNRKVSIGSKHDCYVKLIGTDMSSITLTMDGVIQKSLIMVYQVTQQLIKFSFNSFMMEVPII